MIAKPEHGALYWCILPSMESAGYGDDVPREPWRGKLRIEKAAGGTVLYLSRMSAQGIPDNDWNATARVGARDLFATEPEARLSWADAMIDHGRTLLLDGHDCLVRGMIARPAAWEAVRKAIRAVACAPDTGEGE